GQYRWRLRLRRDAVRPEKTRIGPGQRCRHAAGGRLRHPPRVPGLWNSAGHLASSPVYPAGTRTRLETSLRSGSSGIQYPINQITTRQSFIKSQREMVKSFLKGLIAGLARFRADREFGVKVSGQNLRETDPKILQETYDFWLKVFPKVPNPGPEDATVFLEFMQVKEARDWKDYVDTSLMDEIEREGFLSSVYR